MRGDRWTEGTDDFKKHFAYICAKITGSVLVIILLTSELLQTKRPSAGTAVKLQLQSRERIFALHSVSSSQDFEP